MKIYHGNFSCWSDVALAYNENWYFGGSERARRKRALVEIPKPDKVFYASYVTPDYEGDSLVIFQKGDKFYWNEGSHCSCHGLEDQWQPEEYDIETFIKVLERKIESNYFYNISKNGLKTILKNVKKQL